MDTDHSTSTVCQVI